MSLNPADESVIGEAYCAGESEVNDAVASCQEALKGEWAQIKPWERGRILMKISQLVLERLDALADTEMKETGKPTVFALLVVRCYVCTSWGCIPDVGKLFFTGLVSFAIMPGYRKYCLFHFETLVHIWSKMISFLGLLGQNAGLYQKFLT